jgi:hypothetical protein
MIFDTLKHRKSFDALGPRFATPFDQTKWEAHRNCAGILAPRAGWVVKPVLEVLA